MHSVDCSKMYNYADEKRYQVVAKMMFLMSDVDKYDREAFSFLVTPPENAYTKKQGLRQDSEAATITTWRITFYLSYLPILKTATQLP